MSKRTQYIRKREFDEVKEDSWLTDKQKRARRRVIKKSMTKTDRAKNKKLTRSLRIHY